MVAMIVLLSNSRRSFSLMSIFCLFAGGPVAEGVGGIVEDGVGGWGRVAEAGVRLILACDCLRLLGRGSIILA